MYFMSGFCKGLQDYMATRYHEVSTQHDFQKLLFARRETLYTESLHCFQRGHYSILYVYKVLNSHLYSVVSGFNVSNLEEVGIRNKFVFRLSWCFQKDLYPDRLAGPHICVCGAAINYAERKINHQQNRKKDSL